MKTFNNLIYTCCIFAALGLIWMLLEVVFYGEVQDRAVDNIMSIFIFVSIYYNVKWYREFD